MSEANLDKHLDNPTETNQKANKKASSVPIIRPPKQIATQAELKAKMDARLKQTPKVVDQTQAQIDLKEDFQLQWALNIIEGKPLPANSRPSSGSAKKAN